MSILKKCSRVTSHEEYVDLLLIALKAWTQQQTTDKERRRTAEQDSAVDTMDQSMEHHQKSRIGQNGEDLYM